MVLPVAIGLALGVGLLPLVAAYYLSRQRAVATEQAHLIDYAGWTLQRADLVLSRAKNALRRLTLERHDLCSPAHIERLQLMTADVLSVELIEAIKDDRLSCDSWGKIGPPAVIEAAGASVGDGFELIPGPEHLPSGQAPSSGAIILRYGAYRAHIKKERLVDVLHETPMTLGVATLDGKLVALSGRVAPSLVARLSREELSGAAEEQVYSSVKAQYFYVFAISDRTNLDARAAAELLRLIPLGLIVSAVLIAIIGWVSRQRLSLAGELGVGIKKREFAVHYQPIIELSTGRCVGAEALLRWPRPDGSWVRPDLFIPVAEQHNLIDQITDIMIDRVIDETQQLLSGDTRVHIAINISSSDIESGRFLPILEEKLRLSNVRPQQIWLEATERGFMNADAARRNIRAAREAGHQIAIDDFGTGYSSLSLLETLPLNVLKIDRSFVNAIGHDAALSVVTPHIIAMAHGLGLSIVAEGVETMEQEDYLRGAGVQYAQGWHYAKALPVKEFVEFYMGSNAGCDVAEFRETGKPAGAGRRLSFRASIPA